MPTFANTHKIIIRLLITLRGFTFADEKHSPLVLLVQQQSLRIFAAYFPEKPPACRTGAIEIVISEAFVSNILTHNP